MGFAPEESGSTHFDWLQFSVPSSGPWTIHSYAYESTAGAAIRVETVSGPAFFGCCILGGLAVALAIRRQEPGCYAIGIARGD
jgi:hypothetical protein